MTNHKNDLFGQRMKSFEKGEVLSSTNQDEFRALNPNKPIIARLDGNRFGKFTEDLNYPYDDRFSTVMQRTTYHLLESYGDIVAGYVQSDEITLLFKTLKTEEGQSFIFNARIQKLASILAANASVFFNSELLHYLPEKVKERPVFDCRVWNVPTTEEAINSLLWRIQDCEKNAVQMAARSMFSHKETMDKTPEQLKEKMLTEKNVNYKQTYPFPFMHGSLFVRKVQKSNFKQLTEEQRQELPEKHFARKNPELEFQRSKVIQVFYQDGFSKMPDLKEFIYSSH